MKAGWTVKPLGEVCIKVQDGAHHSPKTTYAEKREGLFPYITSKNIRNEGLDLSKLEYVDFEFHQSIFPRCSPEFGDVLLTKDGANTGNVTLNSLNEPFSMLSSVALIKTERDRLLPEFLVYYLQSDAGMGATTGKMTGAAIKRIILKTLKALEIPLPPLEEQHQIVAVLDEAFEGLARARAHAEANLRDARELFANFLGEIARRHAEIYGTATVEALAEDVTDGDHMPPPKADVGIPFITISNINKDTRQIDFSDTFMVPEAYYNALKGKRQPRAGDVLYTVTGSFGIPILIKGRQPFCFQRHIALVRPKAEVDSEWLYYMLLSPFVFDQANDGATGTAQRTVSLKVLRGLMLPNTPIEMQAELAANLRARWEANQIIVESYRAKIADIDDLRQSLLQKAFAGDLT